MKKILLLSLALVSMLTANAQDKTVLYEYPFATMRSHAYPTTGEYVQNNLLDLNGVGNATTTLTAYTDGTFKIAAWCGVEGYDLDFRISNDSIYILNENAEQKTSGSGHLYWKVPTGLSVYNRIQIFSGRSTYSSISVSESQCVVNLAYSSYVWEPDNTGSATVKAAYYGRGFAATPAKYNVEEAAWDDETSAYVITYDLNTQQITETNVYALGENQYVATDWMGENTGDLYFTVDENDSITVDNIADLSEDSGFWYFYNINLAGDGIQPTWAETYSDGTCFAIGFWYGTDATDSSSYIYRYYFLEPQETEGIKNVKTNADDNAIYNLNGVRMNSANLPKGVYIINGKKVIR